MNTSQPAKHEGSRAGVRRCIHVIKYQIWVKKRIRMTCIPKEEEQQLYTLAEPASLVGAGVSIDKPKS
jgi:hypothetical protein